MIVVLLVAVALVGLAAGFAIGSWKALWLLLVPPLLFGAIDLLTFANREGEPIPYSALLVIALPLVAAGIALGVWLRQLGAAKRWVLVGGVIVASTMGLVALAIIVMRLEDRDPEHDRPGSRFAKTCVNDAPVNFTHYWLGEEFEGLQLQTVAHNCKSRPNANSVEYSYTSDLKCGYTAEGCYGELSIYTRPACEEGHNADAEFLGRFPRNPLDRVRGVPASSKGGLSLLTGDVVVSVLTGPGPTNALAARAAQALRSGPPQLALPLLAGYVGIGMDELGDALAQPGAQGGPGWVAPDGPLPKPVAGALERTLTCGPGG